MAQPAGKKQPMDLITRGVKEPSPVGTATFIGLRAIDPYIQYRLLTGWGSCLLSKLGVRSISASSLPAANVGVGFIDRLGLPLPHLALLGMAVGSTAKQVYWLTALSQEKMEPSAAVAVGVINTVYNGVNILLLLAAATSSTEAAPLPGTNIPWTVAAGAAGYLVGMALEAVSERQRRLFKDDPANKGKVMTEGLWSWARHINYGGYTLWRSSYALVSSGVTAALALGSLVGMDFANRAVPVLDGYCGERYGEQWAAFKRDVKWVLFPGVY